MALNEKIVNKLNQLTRNEPITRAFITEIILNENTKGYGKNDAFIKLIDQFAKELEHEDF